MKLTFIGATGTVTGSKYLLESNGLKILVDCGLFQGLKELRLRNWANLPFNASELDAVVLTHAHIDHSGYLPVLQKHGYKGPIYCTTATAELCKILLPDSGHLQEEEAHFANKHGYSKHHPALPLYTSDDAKACLNQFHPVKYHQKISLGTRLQFNFTPAGHILGAACLTFDDGERTLVFSGDLGRQHDPIIKAPESIQKATYLLVESTYGNRTHKALPPEGELADVINRTAKRKGVILIPAFAVGRAQTALYLISRLKKQKKIPDIPVYLNSPMAISASEIFYHHPDEHRLSAADAKLMCHVAKYIRTVEESKSLNEMSGPMIIISASGMATGGRIIHHLEAFAPDPKNTILFMGYQAAGTRGQKIVDGATEIKIHGKMVPIGAEVVNIDTLSAHADADEIINWMKKFQTAPKMTYVTHGEPASSLALQERIIKELGWSCTVPEYLQKTDLINCNLYLLETLNSGEKLVRRFSNS